MYDRFLPQGKYKQSSIANTYHGKKMDFKQGSHPSKGKQSIIESRVPVHLLDILNLASLVLGSKNQKYPHRLLKFYIHRMALEEFSPIEVQRRLAHGLIKGRARKDLLLKGAEIVNDVAVIKAKTLISDTNDIVKLAVLSIYEDVLRTRNFELRFRLKSRLSKFS